jgi:hypothetical protein
MADELIHDNHDLRQERDKYLDGWEKTMDAWDAATAEIDQIRMLTGELTDALKGAMDKIVLLEAIREEFEQDKQLAGSPAMLRFLAEVAIHDSPYMN